MIFGDILDKIALVWKAFQGEKRRSIYVEDIAIKIYLVDPFDKDVVFWPPPGWGGEKSSPRSMNISDRLLSPSSISPNICR